ncbi:response regulator receiver modulated diguanylate cyclase/phosphodiesterase [Salinisphaera sp. T31B1]
MQNLVAIVITTEPAIRSAASQALAEIDPALEIVHASAPAEAADSHTNAPAAVYCLGCDTEPEAAQRALGLIRGVAGSAPIVMIDAGEAGLTLETAVADGAWDLVALGDRARLQTRLGQAVELGRVRHELLEAGQRLNQSQRRLDVLLSQGQDARATLDVTRIIDPNAAFARLIGVADIDSVRGMDLLDRTAPADRGRVAEGVEQVVRHNSDTTLSFDLVTRHGHRQPVRAVLSPGVSESEERHSVNLVLQATDKEHLPLPEASRRTALDGRMALHAILRQVAGRAKERVLGLIFIAVDDAPVLQSDLGLAEADLLLQEVGLFLLQAVREEDRIFRFGNGEYVMLVERHSANELAESARQLRASLADEIFGDGRHSASLSATLTYSVLSGTAADNAQRLQTLMNTAYQLRADGGNLCQECTIGAADGDADQGMQAEWIARLRQAMTHDRFSLAYQGITSLAGDSQPYFDVLLRYVDDRGALVRPGEFLAAAEKADLMGGIDQWVTRRAIDVIWQQQAKDIHIALFVKLSAATIAATDEFLAWLKQTLAARAIARQNLIFSIREEDARGQIVQARRLATELEALGFRMALTHYGSTAKAIQVLDKMPASFIKLSADFARQILAAGDDERLAQIIASARERDIPLIAEQIEDANSMARLWQAGVNYVQGHFIQEPNTDVLDHTGEIRP